MDHDPNQLALPAKVALWLDLHSEGRALQNQLSTLSTRIQQLEASIPKDVLSKLNELGKTVVASMNNEEGLTSTKSAADTKEPRSPGVDAKVDAIHTTPLVYETKPTDYVSQQQDKVRHQPKQDVQAKKRESVSRPTDTDDGTERKRQRVRANNELVTIEDALSELGAPARDLPMYK